jgi:hypothetical protein
MPVEIFQFGFFISRFFLFHVFTVLNFELRKKPHNKTDMTFKNLVDG